MTNQPNRSSTGRASGLMRTALACLSTAGLLACLAPWALADPPEALPELQPLGANDDANRLISGTTTIIDLNERGNTDLKFMADGPGMLTLSYTDTNSNRSFEVLDPNGQRLNWSSRLRMEHASAGNVQVAYVTVPLAVAGEHTVRLRANGAGQLGVGAAWMPFEQVSIGLTNDPRYQDDVFIQPQVAPPPPINPDPEDATAITPGVAQVGTIPAGPSDRTFAWLSFTAEADGELALIFTSPRADLTLELYELDNYNRALQDIDNDLNSSVGTEGMVINARAGTTYMVSVNNLRASEARFNLRSVWLAGEAEAGAGSGGDNATNGPHGEQHDAAGHEHGRIELDERDAGIVIEGEVVFEVDDALLQADQVIVNRGNFIDDKDLQILLTQQAEIEVLPAEPIEEAPTAVEEE